METRLFRRERKRTEVKLYSARLNTYLAFPCYDEEDLIPSRFAEKVIQRVFIDLYSPNRNKMMTVIRIAM